MSWPAYTDLIWTDVLLVEKYTLQKVELTFHTSEIISRNWNDSVLIHTGGLPNHIMETIQSRFFPDICLSPPFFVASLSMPVK